MLYNVVSMDMNLSKLREMLKDWEAGELQSMGSQRIGHDHATERQQCSVGFCCSTKDLYVLVWLLLNIKFVNTSVLLVFCSFSSL